MLRNVFHPHPVGWCSSQHWEPENPCLSPLDMQHDIPTRERNEEELRDQYFSRQAAQDTADVEDSCRQPASSDVDSTDGMNLHEASAL